MKKLAAGLILMPIVILGLVLWKAHAQNQPQPPPPTVQLEADIVYGKGGSRDLKLDLTQPAEAAKGLRPAIVCIHGGGWTGGERQSMRSFMYFLNAQGFVCISMEYRFTPKDKFPAQLEDVKCAVRWLRANAAKYHVDSNRIGTLGLSAGAHLSALLATTSETKQWDGEGGNADQSSAVQVVAALAGPYDLTLGYKNSDKQNSYEGNSVKGMLVSFLGGRPDEKPDAYRDASPVTHVTKDSPPMLLVHGTADSLVLYEQSELMAQKLKEAGAKVELLPIEGGTHSDFGKDPMLIVNRISDFLSEHLNRRD